MQQSNIALRHLEEEHQRQKRMEREGLGLLARLTKGCLMLVVVFWVAVVMIGCLTQMYAAPESPSGPQHRGPESPARVAR